MSDYMPNSRNRKRYENDDFKPTGSKGAAYILAGLLLALVVGSLFLGTPASDRGDAARSPEQATPAPQR